MDSRSYIKLTGNLTNITGTTGTTGTTYVPPILPLKTCYISLGSWDMSAGHSANVDRCVTIPSSIPRTKIRQVNAIIYTDAGPTGDIYSFETVNSDWEVSGQIRVDSANNRIVLTRNHMGLFCQSGFNGYVPSRGKVGITYSNIQPPSGTTGAVQLPSLQPTNFWVAGNKVTNDGGSPICQFGVVWSTSSTPTLSNGTAVCINGVVGTNVPYNMYLSPLPDGADIYFRQYAKNCEETGYGNICCQHTPTASIPTDVYVGLMECYSNTTPQHKDGLITISPALGTGQCVEVSLDFHQLAQNSGDVACIQIMKSCNGGPYYYEYIFTPPAQTTYYGEGGINQYEGNGTGTITLRKGDCACWIDDISGSGYGGQLRSDFYISNLVASPGTLTAHPDSNQYVHLP
jgi:hypothetical protein